MKTFSITLVACLLWHDHGSAACADEQTAPPAITIPLDPSPPVPSPGPEDQAPNPDALTSREVTDRPEGLPVYTPPHRGAPKTRVGGGTRSISAGANAAEVLTVLSPPQMGRTQQTQPTLYWFLSVRDAGPFEFVLTSADAVAPLWRIRVEGPLEAGIHAVSLRDQNVELEPGVHYQWSVAIVRDPERRSRDLVAIGTLERVAARSTPDGAEAVFTLAERGLWYDALQQVEELIAQSTDDVRLREYRAALLDQAELAQVAQYVRDRPAG